MLRDLQNDDNSSEVLRDKMISDCNELQQKLTETYKANTCQRVEVYDDLYQVYIYIYYMYIYYRN